MRASSVAASASAPLLTRRSSASAHHAVPITPDLDADHIMSFPTPQHLLLERNDPAEYTSSPQLKFQQQEWTKRSSAPLMAWSKPPSSSSRRACLPSPNGRGRILRCYLLTLLLLLTVSLILLNTHRSSSSSATSPSSWSSAASRLYSKTTSRLSSKTLRSPHHTYAYAVPMPNEYGGAYEEHPIHGLMREAKGLWEEKKKQQSETCEEAMEEYKRRYGRRVPEGFQHWWYWAKQNKVQLLDEYDSIMDHIEPFLARRPSEIRRHLQILEDTPDGEGRDHTILHLEKGKVIKRSGGSWRPAVPDGFEFLLEGISHMLPDMVVALFLHDASHTQISYAGMQEYRKAAREGRFVNETEMRLQGDEPFTWRERTCAPDSDYIRQITGLDNFTPPPGPAFVRNHPREMSYCSNPQNLPLHGATSGGIYIRNLEPSFALSRTGPDGDIVWPSTIQYELNPKNESSFREKQDKIVWRGSPDGIFVGRDLKWRQSQRFRLLTLANSNDTSPRLVRQTATDKLGREYQLDVTSNLKDLNARFSDIRATNGPVQCEEMLCEHLRKTMEFVPKASLEEMADHKYVMDVDGNAYSARFRTHLMSNQVPFKATIYEEFYTSKIQPWLHYVPVKMDYSDLYNILTFFSGADDAQRTGNHDDLAEEIAKAGREWAETHWRVVDMQAYVFRLLLEYGRVLDPEREHE
ncbi:hypothetical protein JCM8547_002841 [Rhodosporidiobolus lusitaniae]